MARIQLSIDPNYCPNWKFWSGVREIVQNAKDADEFDGFPMEIDYSTRGKKLTITNKNVTVEMRYLMLLGATSKGGGEQRGQFGEGFVLGALALARAGHDVTVYNGDQVLRPAIEEADDVHFQGSKVFVFNTRGVKFRPDFSVEIEGVTREIWDATKGLFLFLEPPRASEIVKVDNCEILLNEEYQGRVYARGIYVNTVADLEHGYNLDNLKLDRDRNMVDEWDLRSKLADLWIRAHEIAPDKTSGKVYKMLKTNRTEVKNLSWRADEKLLAAVRKDFEDEHGDGVVPVRTMTESKELESLGAKTVVVDTTLKEMLEKSGLSIQRAKERVQSSVLERFSFSDLTMTEANICITWAEKLTQAYSVVSLREPKAQFLESEKLIAIDRRLLSTPRALIQAVAVVEAKNRGVSVEVLLLDLLFPQNGHTLPTTYTLIEEVPF